MKHSVLKKQIVYNLLTKKKYFEIERICKMVHFTYAKC